jgi:hypothetical protein
MGMDVYGKTPSSEIGKRFRRDVWTWHPLALICERTWPKIAKRCKDWHCNGGFGLEAKSACKLANQIEKMDQTKLIDLCLQTNCEMGRHMCPLCQGSGFTKLTEAKTESGFTLMLSTNDPACKDYEGKLLACDVCHGEGRMMPLSVRNYWVNVADMYEFAAFCKASGGFEIW